MMQCIQNKMLNKSYIFKREYLKESILMFKKTGVPSVAQWVKDPMLSP